MKTAYKLISAMLALACLCGCAQQAISTSGQNAFATKKSLTPEGTTAEPPADPILVELRALDQLPKMLLWGGSRAGPWKDNSDRMKELARLNGVVNVPANIGRWEAQWFVDWANEVFAANRGSGMQKMVWIGSGNSNVGHNAQALIDLETDLAWLGSRWRPQWVVLDWETTRTGRKRQTAEVAGETYHQIGTLLSNAWPYLNQDVRVVIFQKMQLRYQQAHGWLRKGIVPDFIKGVPSASLYYLEWPSVVTTYQHSLEHARASQYNLCVPFFSVTGTYRYSWEGWDASGGPILKGAWSRDVEYPLIHAWWLGWAWTHLPDFVDGAPIGGLWSIRPDEETFWWRYIMFVRGANGLPPITVAEPTTVPLAAGEAEEADEPMLIEVQPDVG